MGGGFQPHKRTSRVMAPGMSGMAMRRGSRAGSLSQQLKKKQKRKPKLRHMIRGDGGQ